MVTIFPEMPALYWVSEVVAGPWTAAPDVLNLLP